LNTNWEKNINDLNERQVFKALENKDWDFRTVDGIAKDTGLSAEEVARIIEKYPQMIRLSAVPDNKGRQLYTLASKAITTKERLASVRMFISKSIR
jgi:hypothetical protein